MSSVAQTDFIEKVSRIVVGEDKETKTGYPNFNQFWEKYIMPLKGGILINSRGGENKIIDVDFGGITRITSNDKRGKIDIEIFKLTYNRLLKDGKISRDTINQEYSKRASSGVVLIMSQVPFIKKEQIDNKYHLVLKGR